MTKIVCDICHKDIVRVGGTRYQLTRIPRYIGDVETELDICQNCMHDIIEYVESKKEAQDEVDC